MNSWKAKLCLMLQAVFTSALLYGGEWGLEVVGGDFAQRRNWTEWLQDAEREVRILTRTSRTLKEITFVLDSDQTTYHRTLNGYRFSVTPSLTEREIQAEFIRALLYRRAESGARQASIEPRHIPDWLIAAVFVRIQWDRQQMAPAEMFVATSYLLGKDALPSVVDLVSQPIAAHHTFLFEYYADIAACLLRVLMRANPAFLVQILERLTPQQSPYSSLMPFLPLDIASDKVDQWFADSAARVVAGLGSHTSEDIRRRLMELEQIAVTDPETGEVKQMRLDTVLLEQADYAINMPELSRRLARLYTLHRDAPVLLRPPIMGYIKALDALRNNHRGRFLRDIQASRETFVGAFERTIAVRQYLLENERHQFSNARQLQRLLPFFESGLEPTSYETAVAVYLNRVVRENELSSLEPTP